MLKNTTLLHKNQCGSIFLQKEEPCFAKFCFQRNASFFLQFFIFFKIPYLLAYLQLARIIVKFFFHKEHKKLYRVKSNTVFWHCKEI